MTFQFVKTELGSDPIIVEGYIAASPDAVFRAWTDPEIVMKWFGPQPRSLLSAGIDLQVGGVWPFVMRSDGEETMGFEGEYLVIDPDRRLVMNWSKFVEALFGPSDAPSVSQVEITLSAKGAGTDIRIVHSAIAGKDTRVGFTSGWEHGINNLRDILEGPVPIQPPLAQPQRKLTLSSELSSAAVLAMYRTQSLL